jgi:hypothetical protein
VTTLRKGYGSKALRTLDLSDDYVEKTRPITDKGLLRPEPGWPLQVSREAKRIHK